MSGVGEVRSMGEDECEGEGLSRPGSHMRARCKFFAAATSNQFSK